MKHKIPLNLARALAMQIGARLQPYCSRLEIAGSIRREKPEVGDIELIAVPKFNRDMFSLITDSHQLDTLDWSTFGKWIKGGHKYKQVELPEGINLDLFIVTPPAEWGIQFVIRTGPADFSHRLVTPRKHGGLLPSHMKVKDGAIWANDHAIPTPEEKDVFDLIGLGYIEPKDRQ